jgi:hypothetical protein
MEHTTVVFLGPTLRSDEAAAILRAEYCLPAEQGDIVRAVRDLKASRIALIDGVFASAPAVRHKEILWALSQGVRVSGAASMGALRAAELHGYGMMGHGLIYRWYRATLLAEDDEVAVAMMPTELGAHALSEALIDMRLTFRRAERAGVIPAEMRHILVEAARRLHFTERGYTSLWECAKILLPTRLHPWVEPLVDWIGTHAVRQKRDDALGLLRRLADHPDRDPATVVSPPFRMTEAWATDLDDAGLSLHHG